MSRTFIPTVAASAISLLTLSLALFISVGAQIPSWSIINGGRLNPTQEQIDSSCSLRRQDATMRFIPLTLMPDGQLKPQFLAFLPKNQPSTFQAVQLRPTGPTGEGESISISGLDAMLLDYAERTPSSCQWT